MGNTDRSPDPNVPPGATAPPARISLPAWAIGILAFLTGGGLLAWWLALRTDRHLRDDLLQQTQTIARALNPDRLSVLTGTAADRTLPEYLRLKEQLGALLTTDPRRRLLYLLGRRPNGEVFVFMDGSQAGHPERFQPGAIYEDVPAGIRQVLVGGIAAVEGPYRDPWGAFVSGCAPVVDPRKQALLAVLGLAVDAREWRRTIILHTALPVGLLGLALAAAWLVTAPPRSPPPRAESPWRHLLQGIPARSLALGLVLTLFLAWLAHESEARQRRATFQTLAQSRTANLADTFRDLRDVELEGLGRFYEGSEEVTADEFQQYAAFLTRNRAIHGWSWVEAVPAEGRHRFEVVFRRTGQGHFEIWERDANGNQVPAGERDFYYPVLRLTPRAGHERALGYDLGSDPIRRAALEEARNTGLPTATSPVRLEFEPDDAQGLLFFRPVFASSPDRSMRGLVMAVGRADEMLASAEPDALVTHDLVLAHRDAAPEPLALSRTTPSPPAAWPTAKRPILTFGHTLLITSYAGPEFMRLYPTRAGLLTALVGGLLSVALSTVLGLLRQRRTALERLVQERTAALNASSLRLSTLVRNLQGGVLLEDEQRRILLANQAFCRLFAIPAPPEALAGTDCAAAAEQAKVLFAEPDRFLARLDTALTARQDVLAEELALADGRTFERDYVPIALGGAQLGHLWHYRDITERKLAEAALRRRESILEAVALAAERFLHGRSWEDSIQEVLAHLGQATGSSRAYIFENHTGPDGDWLASQRYEWTADGIAPQIANPDLQGVSWRAAGFGRWLDLMRQGEVISGRLADFPPEERGLLETQDIRALLAVPIYVEDQHWGFMGFDDCLTERDWASAEVDALRVAANLLGEAIAHRRAVAELQASGEKHRLLFHEMLDGFALHEILCDTAGTPVNYRFLAVNPAFERLTGLKADAVVGRTVLEILPRTEPTWIVTYGRVALTGEPATFESFNADLGKYFEVRAFRPAPGQFACIFADVTLSREAQANRAARQRAEAENEAKSVFLANMSHEIRTPLNAILGFGRILERDASLTPTQADQVHSITRSGQHLLNLLNNILDLSKLEAGQVELNPRSFCLPSLLDDLEVMFRSMAQAKGLRFLVERDPTLPRYVIADELKLRQILVNVLGNALKFTKHGWVALRFWIEAAPDSPTNPRPALQLMAEVEDTGPGIPETEVAHIFDAFRQLAAGREMGGTGLGLSICRRLADKMGGTIRVTSQVGKGTCFHLQLPVLPDSLRDPSADAPESAGRNGRRIVGLEPGTGPVRVLVVDDQKDNRDLLRAVLSPLGFQIQEAVNGLEALQIFEQWSPHAVLMDMRMPVMDGAEATRRIKATVKGRSTPIIGLTAVPLPAGQDTDLALDLDCCLSKPFQMEELFERLGKCLRLRYLYAETPEPPPGLRQPPAVTRDEMAALPARLVSTMCQALESGDMASLKQLITEVARWNPNTAEKLLFAVNQYDYESLGQVLQPTPGEPDGPVP